ncbi:MAG: CRISPR-associated protein Cas4 [Tyzzerella sp.]|uniref:CRISPR-associated exonuclease Cas4 n=1 Tax=Candidatus Fimicola merdigallinarum TaxID=2840819 RepID=A0A9D9DXM4_9FIRM|nr:CRISPR-associated protein Cas4 [Candidatus Fimicola merdigallinarum]
MLDSLYFLSDKRFVLCIAVVLIILTVLSLKTATIKKKKSSLIMAGYKLIYTDQKTDFKEKNVEYGKILHSEKYDIQGKPDYIFKKVVSNDIVPFELKSGSIGDKDYPHKGDLLQLASYFIIIEDVYGVRPKFGKLVYKDYMFIVKNTKSIRKEVLKTVDSMRSMMKNGKGSANPSFANCRYCVCRGTVCEYCKKE